MTKIVSQQQRPKKMTRPGTKPNLAKGRLITITNGTERKRINEKVARELVASGEWKFCPKRLVE